SAETLSGLSKGCRVDIAPMLLLNASPAYLLTAIAEQIPLAASQEERNGRTETVSRLHSGNRLKPQARRRTRSAPTHRVCIWSAAFVISLKKIFLYPQRTNLRLKSCSGKTKASSRASWSVDLTSCLLKHRFDLRFAICPPARHDRHTDDRRQFVQQHIGIDAQHLT